MKWFKHDSNAHTDAKLMKVLIKYGADGYALYWMCIEIISNRLTAENITFEIEHDAEILGNMLKIDTLRVEEIMKYMVSIGLVHYNNETGRILCLALVNRLDNTLSQNPEVKKICSSDHFKKLKETLIPLKQSRLDKIRPDKKKKKEYLHDTQFESLWLKYPSGVGKKDALRHFRESVKTDGDLAEINKALDNYKKSKRVADGFIQNGSTWFNNWKDWIDYKEPQGDLTGKVKDEKDFEKEYK